MACYFPFGVGVLQCRIRHYGDEKRRIYFYHSLFRTTRYQYYDYVADYYRRNRFLVWEDVCKHKWRIKEYRTQSKVVLIVTAVLIILPAIYFFFFEFSDMSVGKRILASLFQSVTPRTAGFNTVDLTAISDTGLYLMIILMLIGGSPGSTAGGMKTTTIAVLFSSAFPYSEKRQCGTYETKRRRWNC